MAANAKKYIAEALILLMKDHSIEEITVSELVKRAGVSRMTYYRYFDSKDEILEYYMHYIFNIFTQKEKKSDSPVPFGSAKHVQDSLTFFRQYGDFAKCIYQSGNDSIMLNMVNKYMQSQPGFNRGSTAKKYAFYYYAGALYNCYIEWVLEDFCTPVEELTRVICGMRGRMQ